MRVLGHLVMAHVLLLEELGAHVGAQCSGHRRVAEEGIILSDIIIIGVLRHVCGVGSYDFRKSER